MKITTSSLIEVRASDKQSDEVSTGVSKNHAFWFSLPVEWSSADQAQGAAGKEQPRGGPNLSGATRPEVAKTTGQTAILIVEDNPANQKVLTMQLAHLGFQADVVSSGQAAIEKLTRTGHGYRLVLMDVQMPGMDGLTATRMIRGWEHDQPSHVRIIAITAGATHDDHDNCLKAGMDDFLTKPLRLDTLRAILDNFLGEK